MVAAERPRDCCSACLRTEYCNAFNWYDGNCYLKQWSGTAVQREGSVAGHFSREASCGCETAQGVAINSSSFRRLRTPSARECCAECAREGGCGAWTWAAATSGHANLGVGTVAASEGGEGAGDGACDLKQKGVDLASVRGDGRGEVVVAAVGAVSGRLALRRTVLFVHHHPPHAQLGCDRRLLALMEQLKLDGWSS
eukprot:686134-Prymnesium_polylepis.1